MRVCVVGPGTRFLSGITYYTYNLVDALSERVETQALLLRRLLPRFLYPGAARVGQQITTLELPGTVKRYDGIDWYWSITLVRALAFLRRERPTVLVLQWWTGTALHTYLALALAARLLGIRLVIEFHEALDTGEERIPVVGGYVRALAPRLFRRADAHVVHSDYDRELVCGRYGLDPAGVAVIPHAVYHHYAGGRRTREAPEGCCNLLFFGVIRPYKGLEDLVRAFELIPEGELDRYWLTVVGETWEGHDEPLELIARSPRADRITLVNRYVTDEEADGWFGGADIVVLPYHRSSQSGPLHMAFAYGLPVVATSVGGLPEAAAEYAGSVLVPPRDPAALLAGIAQASMLTGRSFAHPQSFSRTAERYLELLANLEKSADAGGRLPPVPATGR